jgi:hypothetical protein
MKAEKLASFPATLDLPNVARFEFFRKGNRPSGVWLVRQPGIQFALPIVSGTKPGVSDYLPAPYNFLNFAPPVEQILPTVTPFLTLADGTTIVASDGADEIEAAPDGKSVHAVWRRWSVLGTKTGQLVEPGIVADVRWKLAGTSLLREEKLSVSKPVEVDRMWMVVPSTALAETNTTDGGKPRYQFESNEGVLTVGFGSSIEMSPPIIRATGNSPMGKGSRGPVHLLLEFKKDNFTLVPQTPLELTLSMTAKPEETTPESGQ